MDAGTMPRDRRGVADGDRHRSYVDGNGHADSHTHGHTDRDYDTYRDSHTNRYADGDCYANGDGTADANSDAVTGERQLRGRHSCRGTTALQRQPLGGGRYDRARRARWELPTRRPYRLVLVHAYSGRSAFRHDR